MGAFAGRVGVVTGASSGIGAAVARALAAEGMHVVLAARRAEQLAGVAEGIRAAGGGADVAVTDVREEAQVERLVDGAVARHGRLDALVNSAGVGYARTVAEGRTAEWRSTLDTNVLGTLLACRAALGHMLAAGRGDIINVTSVSAHEPWPYLAVYAASKAAIHALSQGLRAEVAECGVRVMTVEVHNVMTDFASNFDPEIFLTAGLRWHALGLLNLEAPLLEPEDVARAVVFQLVQPERASVHRLTLRPRTG